jgi:hypothetical protein
MLVTKQKVLRRFWYPVIPLSHVEDGPKPFTLLGERIVVWARRRRAPERARGSLLPSHRGAVVRLLRAARWCAATTAGPTTTAGKVLRIPQITRDVPKGRA